MKIYVNAIACEMVGGLACIELDSEPMTAQQLAVVQALIPDRMGQFEQLLAQQALLKALATPQEVEASTQPPQGYNYKKPAVKDDIQF